MDSFDKYMYSISGTSYGRYVDDAYVVSPSKSFLRGIIPQAKVYLREHLGLDLNMDKVAMWFQLPHCYFVYGEKLVIFASK